MSGAPTRPPISEATRAKMRAAKLGRKHTPEHNARIAEGLRRWSENAPPEKRRRGIRRRLTDAELAEWIMLQQKHIPRHEALRIIGRTDLLPEGEASAAEWPAPNADPRMTASENAYRRYQAAQRRPVTL